MSQLLPSGGLDLQDKLRALVYQSIEVPGRDLAPGDPGEANRCAAAVVGNISAVAVRRGA